MVHKILKFFPKQPIEFFRLSIQKQTMKQNRSSPLQAVLGAAYVAAGVGVLALLPRRMGQISDSLNRDPGSIDMLFLWFCFGLVGVLLIGGGAKKIITWHRSTREK